MGSSGDRGRSSGSGLLLVVALLLAALVAAGVRLPGGVAGAGGRRADGLRDVARPTAAATSRRWSPPTGRGRRRWSPAHAEIVYEPGARALPVDFRRCRSTACGDGAAGDLVHAHRRGPAGDRLRPRRRLPRGRRPSAERPATTAPAIAPAISTSSTGPTTPIRRTLHGVPVAGARGYHRDDWEGVQIRIAPDGEGRERASSHNGYNYARGPANWASDAGIGPLQGRRRNGRYPRRQRLGPETRLLLVSGGSHAGNRRHAATPSDSPRAPHPPDPARADRHDQHRPLRDLPALAEARLARPGGVWNQLETPELCRGLFA